MGYFLLRCPNCVFPHKRTHDTALWQSEPPEHVSAGLPAWPPSGLCIVSFVSFGSSFGSSFNGLTSHLTASCDQFWPMPALRVDVAHGARLSLAVSVCSPSSRPPDETNRQVQIVHPFIFPQKKQNPEHFCDSCTKCSNIIQMTLNLRATRVLLEGPWYLKFPKKHLDNTWTNYLGNFRTFCGFTQDPGDVLSLWFSLLEPQLLKVWLDRVDPSRYTCL